MTIFIPVYSLLISLASFALSYLTKYVFFLTQYKNWLICLGFISLAVSIISLIFFAKNRGLTEYFHSVDDSNDLRKFLYIPKRINDYTDKTKVDLVQQMYNSCLHYTTINYFRDHVEVRICVPQNDEAVKILREKEEHLLDHLERYSYMKKYMLNNKPEKDGQFNVYYGSRKKNN
ncbi:hypothetical protein B1745_00140 [Lactobacillus amylolyticus]|uniref:hypothetical protein n=1 Tax=Lactobacillus amylolyticus TaxID=83683 RepID=UPI0009BB714A|nr:hypothetical protein [Lactobacillus amylolyticus]ARD06168.1 hypothetical protein B1745_00140 [Lactobacillus amylolyticus]